MKFTPTRISGVLIVDMDRHHDERGWFSRTWCMRELREHDLDSELNQCSSSFNCRRGTLRGIHFQIPPYQEAKLVRCTRGAAFDVAVDLRPHSATYLKWISAELTADNGQSIFIPKGCAHGFQTLQDNTEILYLICQPYHPEAGRGVRWNDPVFAIDWPLAGSAILSERDSQYPDFIPCAT